MTNYNSEQLNLFTQPIAVPVEMSCTVERAAKLVERSTSSIYQIEKGKPYLRKVPTGTWQVHSTGKNDRPIRVDVYFIYDPKKR
ncbi:hypothetical protein K4039_06820 [Lyngbya sp. CCAP 1446/10]|uniref:hypothetical protein n=1 Tax=Lyngbya sp. CCAP 1446/10 TaxID=439293 RepID=UPI00223786FE|nr:hypothetical protein [Lyngbya sp. CCAP 1446/10]MCW6049800.1 hypothetical protein [Lyngbya sp. CCAP 1446/10]